MESLFSPNEARLFLIVDEINRKLESDPVLYFEIKDLVIRGKRGLNGVTTYDFRYKTEKWVQDMENDASYYMPIDEHVLALLISKHGIKYIKVT